MKQKNSKGITLIALIITIILMLILAGVVISITIGKNGIFKTAQYAMQKNSEETAKEKLELMLADLQAHKYTDGNYNENEYIDSYLENENIDVVENVVTVDNWNFEIDRSVPRIKASLGESEVKLTKEVKEYLGKNANGKYMVAVLVKIESNTKIESIEFENADGTILTVTVGKEMIAKDMQMELDREYKIAVKMANGTTENRTILERSVESIKTVEELVAFRDKVNSGLTYEGKTINLANDIDLSSVCYRVDGTVANDKSWEPIGNSTYMFKGIFDGQYNSISNIYINNINNYQGFFGYNSGTIKDLIMDSGKIIVGYGGAPIVGKNCSEISNCMNCNISIESTQYGIGGIVGENIGTIKKCINKSNITSLGNSGGIVGYTSYGNIENCYNLGNINVTECTPGGIVGFQTVGGNIINCYNIGNITGPYIVGGIAGSNGNSYTYYGGAISNCYYINTTALGNGFIYEYNNGQNNYYSKTSEEMKKIATNLGNEYIDDGKKIDNAGNIVDNKDKDGNIIYINNGYPILKWQMENK